MAQGSSSTDVTCLSGYLRKSHGSRPYKEENRLRFFVSVGFNVRYYPSERSTKLCGHFDLRNVIEIRPVPEEEAPDAVVLVIAEGSKTKAKKRLVCSFAYDPPSRAKWLAAWCSAIALKYIDRSLLRYGSEALASEFDETFARQRTISIRKNRLSPHAPRTAPLTPRDASPPRDPWMPVGASAASLRVSTAPRERISRRISTPGSLDTPKGHARRGSAIWGADEHHSHRHHHHPAPELYLTYDVTVPPAAVAGDVLRMNLGNGQEVQIVVPPGATPGDVLDFQLPYAAAYVPAAELDTPPVPKGPLIRTPLGGGLDLDPLMAEAADASAVLVLQARIRGMQTRTRTRPRNGRRSDSPIGISDAISAGPSAAPWSAPAAVRPSHTRPHGYEAAAAHIQAVYRTRGSGGKLHSGRLNSRRVVRALPAGADVTYANAPSDIADQRTRRPPGTAAFSVLAWLPLISA